VVYVDSMKIVRVFLIAVCSENTPLLKRRGNLHGRNSTEILLMVQDNQVIFFKTIYETDSNVKG